MQPPVSHQSGDCLTQSQMIAKLIEPHVDDINNDFAVLASTDFLKDFVKSYFVGTVAAGLAYLAMTDNGYVWSDHFERVRSQQTRIKKPDFVFSGATTGVALMEAQGSRSGSAGAFNTTVSDGYTDQVEPHLGSSILGATATHGYCIGAWLQSPKMAELFIHHTDVPAVTRPGREGRRLEPREHPTIQFCNCLHIGTRANAGRGAESERGSLSGHSVLTIRLARRMRIGNCVVTRYGSRRPKRHSTHLRDFRRSPSRNHHHHANVLLESRRRCAEHNHRPLCAPADHAHTGPKCRSSA